MPETFKDWPPDSPDTGQIVTQVSNLGRVRLYDSVAKKTLRYVEPEPKPRGISFRVLIGSRWRMIQARYLVASLFVENPIDDKYVRYIDGNKANYKASNLKWCMKSKTLQSGSQHHGSKLNEDKVLAIRSAYEKRDKTMAALASENGVTLLSIYNIVHRLTWRHI